jgi:NTE family protein
LRELAGSPRIEELPIDFTAVAVDLVRQREVWLREGDLWEAVRASIAIPGVFTPHVINGRTLVDGGLLAPLPIAATRLSGARHLVAVDMHSRSRRRWPREPADDDSEPLQALVEAGEGAVSPWRQRIGRWLGQQAEAQDPPPIPAPLVGLGFSELMARSLDTMQAQIARTQLALDPPELVIHIPRDAAQFYEFWRAEELIELGRVEAGKVLDAAGY